VLGSAALAAPMQGKLQEAARSLGIISAAFTQGRPDVPGRDCKKHYTSLYKLDCLLLSDKLKAPTELHSALPHALRIATGPGLAEVLEQTLADKSVPHHSTLYRSGVAFDLGTMIFAREVLFYNHDPALAPRAERPLTPDDFVGHVRFDSSPQFKKDLLLGELDHFRIPQQIGPLPTDVAGVGFAMTDGVGFARPWVGIIVVTRMLACQEIGVRASSFP